MFPTDVIIVVLVVLNAVGHQRASGVSPESSIVPNALHMALQPSKEAKGIVKAVPPYPVMHVNDVWTGLTGISQSHAEGQILSQVLRAYEFQNDLIFKLASDCASGRPGSTIFMSYDSRDRDSSRSGQNQYKMPRPLVYYLQVRNDGTRACWALIELFTMSLT